MSSDPSSALGAGGPFGQQGLGDPSPPNTANPSGRNQLRGFTYSTAIASVFFLVMSAPLEAKVFYTQQEAFRLAFPDADRFESKTYVLTAKQVEAIETASRSEIGSKLVTIQTAWRGETLLGHLQIDVHTVRTQSEGVLVALDEKGRVSQVRVLAFHEPLDYLPAQRWYDGFKGKGPADAIRIGHDVDAVTGATLTTRATSAAIRRTLAYYKILLRS
jgi:Na+-translocating ferredoxin:NAD+ oxidoreductase RnfG subunit